MFSVTPITPPEYLQRLLEKAIQEEDYEEAERLKKLIAENPEGVEGASIEITEDNSIGLNDLPEGENEASGEEEAP